MKYDLKHHIVEILPMRDDKHPNKGRYVRATQPMDAGWLSFAILGLIFAPQGDLYLLRAQRYPTQSIRPYSAKVMTGGFLVSPGSRSSWFLVGWQRKLEVKLVTGGAGQVSAASLLN